MSIFGYIAFIFTIIIIAFGLLQYKRIINLTPSKIKSANDSRSDQLKKNNSSKTEIKYRALDNLFTPTEQKFLSVLESIAGDQLKVFGKVRISDIITPAVNKFEKGSGWHWLFSQISQKHVDFVITDTDLNLVCAVELNDPSHKREDRKKRDQFVTEAFESANVPLVMIDTQHKYLDKHIAETIANKVASVKTSN
ncbi:DUF2726 domain-containing protein [Thiomicrorhabdus sp.]|uniref:DUF2726 domain-containing protein n=1 Tax=Thiomicrorhabdus sp. TaxID=2039724 RepID=UPI002AA816FC|nr:DUF2726 domain-containing protein [Thiomicrorhabdus sp.]